MADAKKKYVVTYKCGHEVIINYDDFIAEKCPKCGKGDFVKYIIKR